MKLSKQTTERMRLLKAKGYTIIIGNDRNLPNRPKWQGHDCVRLCLTNSKTHGWPVRTVWAVKPNNNNQGGSVTQCQSTVDGSKCLEIINDDDRRWLGQDTTICRECADAEGKIKWSRRMT